VVVVSAIGIFGNVQTFYIQLSLIKITVAIIETGFTASQAFNFRSGQYKSRYVFVFKKIFVIRLAVTDFHNVKIKNSSHIKLMTAVYKKVCY